MIYIIFTLSFSLYIIWAYRAWLYLRYKKDKDAERNFYIFILKQTFLRSIGIGAYTPFLILNDNNLEDKKIIITINTLNVIAYLLMVIIVFIIIYDR
jgi:hypothetical protein